MSIYIICTMLFIRKKKLPLGAKRREWCCWAISVYKSVVKIRGIKIIIARMRLILTSNKSGTLVFSDSVPPQYRYDIIICERSKELMKGRASVVTFDVLVWLRMSQNSSASLSVLLHQQWDERLPGKCCTSRHWSRSPSWGLHQVQRTSAETWT